jgi:MscS family membrane protein
MSPTLPALLLAFLAAVLARPALADEPSCANPQAAARSLLDWQQPGKDQPDLAAKCLDLPAELAEDPARTARQLKAVLDARGLYVPTDDLPLDPEHTDEDGLHRVQPIPTYPLLTIEKHGDRWLYSRQLVAATPSMYRELASVKMRISGWLPSGLAERSFGGVAVWQAFYVGGLLLAALLVGLLAQKLLAEQLIRLASKLRISLDAQALGATRWPLTWFAAGAVLVAGLPEAQLGVRTSRILIFLSNVLLSVSAVLVASRLVDVGAHFFARRATTTESKLDDQVIPLVSRAIKTAIWTLGGVFIVQNMGVDVGSLIAGVGIGGLAIALAAKDTAANVFGSLTIFTDRPFQIGDWVVLGGSVEGVVEEVGFRSTRIRTFYGSVISVPNAKVANETIDNMGQRANRRVKATIGVTYDTPPETLQAFVEDIRAHLNSNPAVAEGTREVHLASMGASSLDVMLYFFLDVPGWSQELDERAKIYMEIMRLAEKHGVSFAFPSQSIYVESLPGRDA